MQALPCLFVCLLSACSAGLTDRTRDDTDPSDTDVRTTCAWSGPGVAEMSHDFLVGPHVDGDPIAYGKPPQGGAPYSPFAIRVHADFDLTHTVLVEATAVERGTERVLGTAGEAPIPLSFLCSNTGPYAGWLLAGEVHVRYWDQELPCLADRTVEVGLRFALPGGEVVDVQTSGALAWTLGVRDPADTDSQCE